MLSFTEKDLRRLIVILWTEWNHFYYFDALHLFIVQVQLQQKLLWQMMFALAIKLKTFYFYDLIREMKLLHFVEKLSWYRYISTNPRQEDVVCCFGLHYQWCNIWHFLESTRMKRKRRWDGLSNNRPISKLHFFDLLSTSKNQTKNEPNLLIISKRRNQQIKLYYQSNSYLTYQQWPFPS